LGGEENDATSHHRRYKELYSYHPLCACMHAAGAHACWWAVHAANTPLAPKSRAARLYVRAATVSESEQASTERTSARAHGKEHDRA